MIIVLKSAIYDLVINFNHNDFEQFYNFYNLPKYIQISELLIRKHTVKEINSY